MRYKQQKRGRQGNATQNPHDPLPLAVALLDVVVLPHVDGDVSALPLLGRGPVPVLEQEPGVWQEAKPAHGRGQFRTGASVLSEWFQ